MSARQITCLTIVCDECGSSSTDIDLDSDAPTHFTDRAEAAAWLTYGGWAVPTDTAGPDLCPRCVCISPGHNWQPTRASCHVDAYCPRCQRYRRVSA